jgi:hypothetical protein
VGDLRKLVKEIDAQRARGEVKDVDPKTFAEIENKAGLRDTPVPAEMVLRQQDGKYFVNNNEVNKQEFDKTRQQSDQAMGIKRDETGKRIRPSPEERRRAAMSELDGMKKGGKVSSASKRADGCAVRGKTRGRIV